MVSEWTGSQGNVELESWGSVHFRRGWRQPRLKVFLNSKVQVLVNVGDGMEVKGGSR